MIAVYLAVYLLVGWKVLLTAAKNIAKGEVFDENFLMSISTIGAFCIGEYPEGIAVMLFYRIGEYLQERAVGKSRKAIGDLMELKVDYAVVLVNGIEERKDPADVLPGTEIIVKPGERFPLDGQVISGSAYADPSPLTGESIPVSLVPGSVVFSGYINQSGVVTVRTTAPYSESAASRILTLVEEAAEKKAKTERIITKFAAVYTPVVVLSAVLLAFVPPLILSEPLVEWVRRALVFLVVSCPCALVVSVPLTFFSGIGEAGRRGILIKGGDALTALAKVNTVVFDKTGTLTMGIFEVDKVYPADGVDESQLTGAAYKVERYSNHPIAKAITVRYSNNSDFAPPDKFEEKGGYGITAVFDGDTILAGNGRLMGLYGITFFDTGNDATVVHIAENGKYLGCISVSDIVRESTASAVKNLRNIGIERIVMLTGDNERTASVIAEKVGIDNYSAGLLPGDKVFELERLYFKTKNAIILYVGDGINDAPVLARADVGAAMGGIGSDAAAEAADFLVINDNLAEIPAAIGISRATMKIVTQNIVLSVAVKFAVLGLAAFGLAGMWLAVFADVGVTVLVALNSIRRKSRGMSRC